MTMTRRDSNEVNEAEDAQILLPRGVVCYFTVCAQCSGVTKVVSVLEYRYIQVLSLSYIMTVEW